MPSIAARVIAVGEELLRPPVDVIGPRPSSMAVTKVAIVILRCRNNRGIWNNAGLPRSTVLGPPLFRGGGRLGLLGRLDLGDVG